MRSSKPMAVVIKALAAAHNFDLTTPDTSLVLSNDPYTRLVVGVEGKDLISVAHRALPDPGDDAISDPDMLFFTGYGPDYGWVPVEITMATGYYQQAAELTDGTISAIYRRALGEQTDFANMWARNLREQGWLTRAQVTA